VNGGQMIGQPPNVDSTFGVTSGNQTDVRS
jgi:hypothetical protein